MNSKGRNKGKRSYAIVDQFNKIQVVLNSGGMQKIYSTKVSAFNHICPGIGLKVVPVQVIFIEKPKTKKHG